MILLRQPLGMGGIVIAFVFAWASPCSFARAETTKFDPSIRPEFSEPVTLASKDGVLEVTLTAHQGAGHASIPWPRRCRTCSCSATS